MSNTRTITARITLDGDTVTSHYRSKVGDIGLAAAVASLMNASNITEGDARAVLSGTKKFMNDANNELIIVDEQSR